MMLLYVPIYWKDLESAACINLKGYSEPPSWQASTLWQPQLNFWQLDAIR